MSRRLLEGKHSDQIHLSRYSPAPVYELQGSILDLAAMHPPLHPSQANTSPASGSGGRQAPVSRSA